MINHALWQCEVKMEWLERWNVDLPKLTSISSEGYGFSYPYSVTLESISEYWILMVFRYSKSSKCQIPHWLSLSIPESSIEINSRYYLIDLMWFHSDVSPIFADLVKISQWWFWLGSFWWLVTPALNLHTSFL